MLTIARSANSETIMTIMSKEVTLGYIAEYVRLRTVLGHPKRLGRFPAGTGGGPVNNGGNLEATGHPAAEY